MPNESSESASASLSESAAAQSSFFEIHVQQLGREHEDLATERLFSIGAEGVSENLPFRQVDLRYDPEIELSHECHLVAYFRPEVWMADFSQQAWQEFQQWLRQLSPNSTVKIHQAEQKDWLEEWKKGFEPFCFVEPFWVVPAWLPAPSDLKPWQVLRIEPGMAFGTGTHETTQICARLLIDYARSLGPLEQAPLRNKRVLDVGCGTGILGLVALRLGAEHALGLDIDPEARRAGRENLQLNDVSGVLGGDTGRMEIVDFDLADLSSDLRAREPNSKGAFDIVLANIIDGVLLQLAENLSVCVQPGGVLIVSGILNERRGSFLERFTEMISNTPQSALAREESEVQRGEWCGFCFRRELAQ